MAKGNDKWHESFRGFINDLLDRLPGWPSERFMIILMVFALGSGMLIMAKDNPELWRQELYKTILTVVIVTGFVNMILAFYFSANTGDEQKSANSGAAFLAMGDQAKAARIAAETAARAAATAANGNGNGGSGSSADEGGDGTTTTTTTIELPEGASVTATATGRE